MDAVGRSDNKLERRGVIKMLLDAGVESSRELSERSGLCKGAIQFGSQWVTGSKGVSMPLVARLRQY